MPLGLLVCNIPNIIHFPDQSPKQVTFPGLAGAWATAAAKLAAENMARPDRRSLFQPQLRMWVYEEEFQGRKLSELVNEHHENVKYLPGVKLPASIVACPDLEASTALPDHSSLWLNICGIFACLGSAPCWLGYCQNVL